MNNFTLNDLARQERMRRELLQKSDLVPPLPEFVVRLLALLNKPETEPHDLEFYMQNDQVLVAKMLAMVNSPFYGLNRTVRTIKDAVMVLGFRGVRSLVLASSTAKFMQRDFSCYGHDTKGLWTHAACVAAGARTIARACKLGAEVSEQLFVAGLLHDIGKLLLTPYLSDALRAQPADTRVDAALERKLMGIDHTEAGALVTAKWNLATEVQEVIKAHHDRGQDGDTRFAAVVRLADAVAHERGVGFLPGRASTTPEDVADLAALGIADAAVWAGLRNEVVAAMDQAVATLARLS
ncbi:MAG: HDOD domain-containing protein [Planctomycetota bacterium]